MVFDELQDGPETCCHGVDTLNTETGQVRNLLQFSAMSVFPDLVNNLEDKILQVVRFLSKVTLLASGGAGHIYPSTTNPPVNWALSLSRSHALFIPPLAFFLSPLILSLSLSLSLSPTNFFRYLCLSHTLSCMCVCAGGYWRRSGHGAPSQGRHL